MTTREIKMERLILTNAEVAEVDAVLHLVFCRYQMVNDSDFLREAPVLAHELPKRLRVLLNDFRLKEPETGACLISGFAIDDGRIGKTPAHWRRSSVASPTFREDALLVVLASLLGDVFGWLTQQDGHIVHDIMPIREHDDEQIETGSKQYIMWHNDDAFHPSRADYLGMLCLRNPDRTATTFGFIETSALSPKHVETLFQRRFRIRPDESHLDKNRSDLRNHVYENSEVVIEAYTRMSKLEAEPECIAVLSGNPETPYVRIDPCTTSADADDSLAQAALDALVEQISGTMTEVVLSPGEVIFIDNFRVVHGRQPFKARHDGNDRWMKRVGVTRDLRKSRGMRSSASSRLIH
jgi:Fe(II)/alpha-ketoglutarate-dependent arginine beta-hydroxylase